MSDNQFLRRLRYLGLRTRRAGKHAGAFLRYTTLRFFDDQCPLWAAMLCYASLLSVVPLMVVAFGIISAFPVFESWSGSLQAFIFDNFVPATGDAIQKNLQHFADQATQLSAVGTAFLIATAILLMVNMERALNQIWRATTPRTAGSRFVVYWAVLTVGPILFGASVAISSYIASLPVFEATTATLGVQGMLLPLAPFVFSALAFTLIFLIVPSVSVPWRHALIGGIVTSLLFEAAKAGFSLYITKFPTYETLYGAFAAFPIFLIWIYLSWIVTLVGASFAAALQSYRPQSTRNPWPRHQELILLYRFVRHLWLAQKEGTGLSTDQLLQREPRATHDQGVRLLHALDEHHLATLDDDGDWLLTRDLDDVTLADLWGLLSTPFAPGAEESAEDIGDGLRQALTNMQTSLDDQLRQPLTKLF